MDARTPTPEQQAIIDGFLTGADLTIEAGAGSGKTTTLRMLSETTAKRGLYIAYNRAIADDAKRSFPSNVECRTAHSLAYAAVGKKYRDRLNGPRMAAREAARILGVTTTLRISDDRLLGPDKLARFALQTVAAFCYSSDREVGRRHVPYVLGIDHPAEKDQLADVVTPIARRAWEDIQRANGQLKFQHDHYLKIWALANPTLTCDFVLLDEAQDANPVVADIVNRQGHAQRILVGDRSQAIYGWRGAIDAMSTFSGRRLTLSQSFRFGPAIAAEANKWLELLDAPLRLKGFDKVPSTLGELGERADAVLCRTNAEAIANVMSAMADGRRAALVGGGREIRDLAEAAISLKAGKGTSHPELFLFRTWGDLQEYVEHDPAGSDLKVFVDLIDAHGPERVIETMDRLSEERHAHVIVSTAHRAKGREWDRVRIATDFREPKDPDASVSPAEAMLAYVAVTRARKVLDRTGLAWIDSHLEHRTATAEVA